MNRFFFGSPRNFNDPYDCALKAIIRPPSIAEVELIREKLSLEAPDELRANFRSMSALELGQLLTIQLSELVSNEAKIFLDTRGVTCFSEAPDNLLMWSHYAEKGTGFCLEFETSDPLFENKFHKVKYQDSMPEISVTQFYLDGAETADVIGKLYCTKSTHWSYEKEWRAIHQVKETPFGYPMSALKGVYFGPETPRDVLEIICLVVLGQTEDVTFYQGRRNEGSFSVLFNKVTYASHLQAKKSGLI